MAFAPKSHLHDDIVQALFSAVEPLRDGLASNIHAMLRTLRWEHDANFYVQRGAHSVATFKRLEAGFKDAASTIRESFNGWEYPAPVVWEAIRSILGLIAELFPNARNLYPRTELPQL